MNERNEAKVALLVVFPVLLSALTDPRITFMFAVILLVGFAIYTVVRTKTNFRR